MPTRAEQLQLLGDDELLELLQPILARQQAGGQPETTLLGNLFADPAVNPTGDEGLGEGLSNAASNLPHSLANRGRELEQVISHPLDTLSAIGSLGMGALDVGAEAFGAEPTKAGQFARDAGGQLLSDFSSEGLQRDPTAALSTVASVLSPGLKAGGLGRASKFANVAADIPSAAIGAVAGPIGRGVAKGGAKALSTAGDISAEVLGRTTGSRAPAIKEAFKAGREGAEQSDAFKLAVRDQTTKKQIGTQTIDALRAEEKRLGAAKGDFVDANADALIDIDSLIDDTLGELEDLGIRMSDSGDRLIFPKKIDAKAQSAIQEAMDVLGDLDRRQPQIDIEFGAGTGRGATAPKRNQRQLSASSILSGTLAPSELERIRGMVGTTDTQRGRAFLTRMKRNDGAGSTIEELLEQSFGNEESASVLRSAGVRDAGDIEGFARLVSDPEALSTKHIVGDDSFAADAFLNRGPDFDADPSALSERIDGAQSVKELESIQKDIETAFDVDEFDDATFGQLVGKLQEQGERVLRPSDVPDQTRATTTLADLDDATQAVGNLFSKAGKGDRRMKKALGNIRNKMRERSNTVEGFDAVNKEFSTLQDFLSDTAQDDLGIDIRAGARGKGKPKQAGERVVRALDEGREDELAALGKIEKRTGQNLRAQAAGQRLSTTPPVGLLGSLGVGGIAGGLAIGGFPAAITALPLALVFSPRAVGRIAVHFGNNARRAEDFVGKMRKVANALPEHSLRQATTVGELIERAQPEEKKPASFLSAIGQASQ
jgi:hypothetical protein